MINLAKWKFKRKLADAKPDIDPGVAPGRLRFSWLLAGAGWSCVWLGVAGIFLPLLPTVPLLLLAAACFARSSPRCYAWLLEHPQLGPLVTGYLDGTGIPLRAKVMAITTLWLSVSVSLYFAVPPQWVKISVLSVAGGITLYLLCLPIRSEGAS